MPEICNELAGLIVIKVFLVLKNCVNAKALMHNAININTEPIILEMIVKKKSLFMGNIFWKKNLPKMLLSKISEEEYKL